MNVSFLLIHPVLSFFFFPLQFAVPGNDVMIYTRESSSVQYRESITRNAVDLSSIKYTHFDLKIGKNKIILGFKGHDQPFVNITRDHQALYSVAMKGLGDEQCSCEDGDGCTKDEIKSDWMICERRRQYGGGGE